MDLGKRWANPSVLNVLLIAICGCSAESTDDLLRPEGTSDAAQLGAIQAASTSGCDPTVAAGDGWINRPVTAESGQFNAGWRSTPSGSSDGRPIDSVIGLSRAPATGFTDLGLSLRFNQNGAIDARDGGGYVGGFPYTFGEGPYEFQLLVDVPSHRYSVWVRHLDSPFKPFEVLAQSAAFRTEQQSVASLGNLATVIDSAAGAVQTCGYSHQPAAGCTRSGPGVWQARPFTTLGNSHIVLDFYAWSGAAAVDAVVGAALGAPTRFSDLAAIVRFRPDGYLDARNGSTYAASVGFTYAPHVYYHLNLDIDLGASRYTVTVASPNQNAVVLARDYAFRTERTGVASLDHLAQFVDGAAGEVNTCALVSH